MWGQAREEQIAVPHAPLQMPFHGGLPTGTIIRLKKWGRRPVCIRRQRFLPIPASRYRQAIDFQDSSCLTIKKILLFKHLNLDMTIFCFLSGLCPRAKILKWQPQPKKQHICKPHKPTHDQGLQKSCFFTDAPVLNCYIWTLIWNFNKKYGRYKRFRKNTLGYGWQAS